MNTVLTKSEIRYLLALGEGAETGEIAARLGVAKSSVSRALDKLCEKKLAVRLPGGAKRSAQGEAIAARYRICVEEIAARLRAAGYRPQSTWEIACGIASALGSELERFYQTIKEES